jgi:hypothetical protein
MANIDAPFGLMPVRHLNGNAWNGATIRCKISASYGTALFVGDPVVLEPTNTSRGTTERAPTVIRSDGIDGDFIFGVITSFEVDPTNLTRMYSPANTASYCNVCVSPDVVYWIRDDGVAALTKAQIGANAVGIFTHSGDTTTGISKYELNSSTDAPAEDASNPLLILGVADVEDNEFDGSTDTHIIWEVLINMHQLRSTGDGTGALGELGA